MIAILQNNRQGIDELCAQFKVAELYVFGSAISGHYNAKTSDIDFAVLFKSDIPVEDMADYYFGLIENLEKLLKHNIDIVTLKSIKNVIFKEELERTMLPLYAA